MSNVHADAIGEHAAVLAQHIMNLEDRNSELDARNRRQAETIRDYERSGAITRLLQDPQLRFAVEHGAEKVTRSFVSRALAEIARELGYGAAVASEEAIEKVEPVLRALAKRGIESATLRDCGSDLYGSRVLRIRVPELHYQILI